MSITRLSGGITPADGSDPRTFPTIFNAAADYIENGYRYAGTKYFTSDGTFEKADPLGTGDIGLRAVRVRVQGAGGGGGSTDYCGTTGEAAAASGGGAGAYAESFILAASLGTAVTVTRGSGGAGATGGTSGSTEGADGSSGGSSSFGSGESYEVSAGGGTGGGAGLESTRLIREGGSGTQTTATGDLTVPGATSSYALSFGSDIDSGRVSGLASNGADSLFGAGGVGSSPATASGATVDGDNGDGYGAGGGGGAAGQADGTPVDGGDGGNGTNGIVIVDCYV